MLKTKLPSVFKHREMDDLGCGDGKITLRLKEVFQPRKLRGFDVHPSLIRRARSVGIEAELQNLDESLPSGELAVMWGVLHHLNNREACLKMIKDNYSMVFIREPIKNKAIKGFEMGQPLIKEEIEGLVQRYFPEAQTFYYGHCIFIFYVSPGYK
jgi:2-polyprenyl-3-methyl-5-hydroxy-6-metoxy-1,4-benzoquinol methylase